MPVKRFLSSMVLVILLTVSIFQIGLENPKANENNNTFIDLKGHWAENDIDILVNKCPSITGFETSEGRVFRPNASITRAELVTMLAKCLKKTDMDPTKSFSDVQDKDWFFSFVLAAKKAGLISGYADGTFRPLQLVTRPEGLKMILLAKYSEKDIKDGSVIFKDVPSNAWFRKFVRFAYEKGFVAGISETQFGANQIMTRAEVAKIMIRTLGYMSFGNSNKNINQNKNQNKNTNLNGNSNTNFNYNINQNLNSSTSTLPPMIGGCPIFPKDNSWNQDISSLPLHPNSDNFIKSIGENKNLHPDFGGNGEYGIPFIVVPESQPKTMIHFTAYGDESDAGPHPIPVNAPIEGGENSDGDRHVIVLQQGVCKLYELYRAFPQRDGTWNADSAAVFHLMSNALRPDFWTSADAAGLAILPGLVRYDEVAAGSVNHALRFTVSKTQKGFIHPATHYASNSTDSNVPPMGLRLRLKADFDVSSYSGQSRVILEGLKKYGMMVADNGSDWFITGAADTRWNDEDLGQLKKVPGNAFEAVNTGEIIR